LLKPVQISDMTGSISILVILDEYDIRDVGRPTWHSVGVSFID